MGMSAQAFATRIRANMFPASTSTPRESTAMAESTNMTATELKQLTQLLIKLESTLQIGIKDVIFDDYVSHKVDKKPIGFMINQACHMVR